MKMIAVVVLAAMSVGCGKKSDQTFKEGDALPGFERTVRETGAPVYQIPISTAEIDAAVQKQKEHAEAWKP